MRVSNEFTLDLPRERRARLSAGMARAITNGSLRDSWSLSRRRMRADIQPQTTITSIFRARTSSSSFWSAGRSIDPPEKPASS